MQRMRDLLRGSLGRSLRTLPEEDRLVAAWPVACGPALAAHGEVLGLDGDYVLHVRVLHAEWREQFMQMRSMLTNDLRRIAGARLEAIHFEERPGTRPQERVSASAAARRDR
jgi:hypothetical protein